MSDRQRLKGITISAHWIISLPRKPFIKRDILMAADSIYRELHGHEDGSVPATFQVIYLVSREALLVFRILIFPPGRLALS